MTPFDFVLLALAAWRLAYLLAKEDAPFKLMARIRQRTALGGLLTCIYCASVWTALLVFVLWQFEALRVIVTVAAISGLALMAGNYTGSSQQ